MKTVYEALVDLAANLPKSSILKVTLSQDAYSELNSAFVIPGVGQQDLKVQTLVTENGEIAIEVQS